jgi:hypothetical protein
MVNTATARSWVHEDPRKDPKIETACSHAREKIKNLVKSSVARNILEFKWGIAKRVLEEENSINEYEKQLVESIQEKLDTFAGLAEDPKWRFTLLEKELIGRLKESLQDKIFHSKVTGLSFQSKFNTQDEEIRGLIFYVAFLCARKNPATNCGDLWSHVPLGFDTMPLYPLGVNSSQHLATILNSATEHMQQANWD